MNFMNGKVFVDTNILVYAHDRSAGVKHERARAFIEKLWKSNGGVVSTQVLQELCVNLGRKAARPMSAHEIRNLIEDYMAWEVIVNTAESIVEALAIMSRFKISFWDALIVHAAGISGAAILYSEDLADGQKYDAIRVVNPLKSSEIPN
jgi:predicted nucleic acid-binding protein